MTTVTAEESKSSHQDEKWRVQKQVLKQTSQKVKTNQIAHIAFRS